MPSGAAAASGRSTPSTFFLPSEADQAAEYAEALGASAPLLDLVDTLFELQTRGFVWRQVRRRGSVPEGRAPPLPLLRLFSSVDK